MKSDDNFEKFKEAQQHPTLFNHMKQLASFALLPIFGSFLFPFFSILNTAVCGRLGNPNYLAGYALGSLALTIIGTSILIALSSMPAVIGQANGSKNYRLARIYLHRQYVITAIGSIVVLIPLINIKPILLKIG